MKWPETSKNRGKAKHRTSAREKSLPEPDLAARMKQERTCNHSLLSSALTDQVKARGSQGAWNRTHLGVSLRSPRAGQGSLTIQSGQIQVTPL